MEHSRLLKKLGCLAVLGTSLLCHPKEAGSQPYLYFGGNLYFNGDLSSTTEVETVPEDIRTVPEHLEDSALQRQYIIEDKSISSKQENLGIEGKFGLGVRSGKMDLRIGLTLKGQTLLIPQTEHYSNANEKNYKGEGRTKGAALIYNFLDRKNFCPGISIELGQNKNIFGQEKDASIAKWSIYYSLGLTEISVENGWDRYGHFEPKDDYKLAEVITQAIRLNWELLTNDGSSKGLYVEVTIPSIIDQTTLAEQTKFKVTPSLSIGLYSGFDFNFPLKKKK